MTPVQNKKSLFHWTGITDNHNRLTGKMTATNKTQVSLLLKHQQIRPTRITRQRSITQHKLTHNHIEMVCRQLGTLLQAGISISEACQLLQNTLQHLTLKNFLAAAHKEVTCGNLLSTVFLNTFYINDTITTHLIIIGEKTGLLGNMLLQVATLKEKQRLLANQMKQACFYPFLVLFVTLLITLGMLIFVIPSFQQLFSSTLSTLPIYTRAIMWLSLTLRHHAVLILFLLTIFSFSLITLSRYPFFSRYIKNALFSFPLLSSFCKKITLLRFTTTLAITLSSGISLLDAIKLTHHCTAHPLFCSIINHIERDLHRGISLHSAIKHHLFFPPEFSQLIKVGEESGTLDIILNKLVSLYNEELEQQINYLKKLVEPLLMLIVGALIGGLVIAMYLPIFKLGTVI